MAQCVTHLTHTIYTYIYISFFYYSIPLWIIAVLTSESQYVKRTFFKKILSVRTVRLERIERIVFAPEHHRSRPHERTYSTFRAYRTYSIRPRTPAHIGTGKVSCASGHHAEEPINVKDRHGVQLSHGRMIHDGKLFQCTEMIE